MTNAASTRPVLQLAKLKFTVMSTKHRCHAISIVKEQVSLESERTPACENLLEDN